jgi:hypothetical protein
MFWQRMDPIVGYSSKGIFLLPITLADVVCESAPTPNGRLKIMINETPDDEAFGVRSRAGDILFRLLGATTAIFENIQRDNKRVQKIMRGQGGRREPKKQEARRPNHFE